MMNRSSVISFVLFGSVLGNLRNCNITGFKSLPRGVPAWLSTHSVSFIFPKLIFVLKIRSSCT